MTYKFQSTCASNKHLYISFPCVQNKVILLLQSVYINKTIGILLVQSKEIQEIFLFNFKPPNEKQGEECGLIVPFGV